MIKRRAFLAGALGAMTAGIRTTEAADAADNSLVTGKSASFSLTSQRAKPLNPVAPKIQFRKPNQC
jgi:hypothetical protein